MGTYIKPVTRIDHIHATGINFSLQLFSATIMISSGAFLLTLFVLSGAKVMGKGKGVFRQADFTEDIAIMGNGGSIFWLVKTEQEKMYSDKLTLLRISRSWVMVEASFGWLKLKKKVDFVTSKVLDQSKTTWIGAKCEKCETAQNVATDKWFWENGEQLFVANDIWGTESGRQMPYDNEGRGTGSYDAINAVIMHDDTQGWYFGNYAHNNDYYGLCELEL